MEAQRMTADDETSICNFINEKIKARDSKASEVPFCVLNLDNVFEKLQKWRKFLPRVKPFYAVKCNSTPVVLKMLGALGTGFDCASKKEMEMVKDFDQDKIIYAHTAKPQSHIKYALCNCMDMMTFDCVEELHKISTVLTALKERYEIDEWHPQAKLVLRIAVDDSKSLVQLNAKFGAKRQDVAELLKQAKQLCLNVIGVSFHVGSACQDRAAYKTAIKDAQQVFKIAETVGFELRLLDIGGGFNGKNDDQTSFEQMSIGINEALDEFFPDPRVKIIAEPGRYFVDTACTLAVNVIAKKVVQTDPAQDEDNGNGLRTFMYYISDGIYGSMSFKIYHSETYRFYPHRQREDGVQTYPSIIWGPTCDSLDRLTDTVQMPELDVGEWLLVDDIGAYSVAAAGDFNGFEKAQIYPVRTENMEYSAAALAELQKYSVSVLGQPNVDSGSRCAIL